MSDEVLIECVREYIILYDPQNKYYHDNTRKENAWSEISKKTGQSVSDCKKRWTALRDNFRKALKSRKTTSGQANIIRKKWKYEDIMSFMIPFYAERGQKTNLEESQEGGPLSNNSDDEVNAHCVNDNVINSIESLEHPPDNSCTHSPVTADSRASSKLSRQQQSNPMTQVLKNYFEEKRALRSSNKGDHLHKFFDAMQETVRTFSPCLQIEIKSKISNIVTEYELKNLMTNQLSNMSPNNHLVLGQVQSNEASHSSTGSETAVLRSPLLSPGSESYPMQWQAQTSVAPYSSSAELPVSRSPLSSSASENNPVQWQDQRNVAAFSSRIQTDAISPRFENYARQWQHQTSVPGSNSAPASHLSLGSRAGNSIFDLRVTQENENKKI